MAILPMKRIQIFALSKNKKQILDLLQRFGAVQIEDIIQDDSVFIKQDTEEEIQEFERKREIIEKSLEILSAYVSEDNSILKTLQGKEVMSFDTYNKLAARHEEIYQTGLEIIELDKQIADYTAEIHRLQVHIDTLEPWSNMDIPLEFEGTRTTSAIIGTLPGALSSEDVLAKLAELVPEVDALHIEQISINNDQSCIMVLCPKHERAIVEGALRAMGFARPSLSTRGQTPANLKVLLKKEQKDKKQRIQEAKDRIILLSHKRKELQFLVDWLSLQIDKAKAAGLLLESNHTFIAEGYILESEAEALAGCLANKFLTVVDIRDPDPDEETPVLLKNNKFNEPMEGIIRSFSFPGKGEIDPSAFMSFFYYILFGLMLSDAAYGLIMAVGCGICLWKFPNMEKGLRKTLRMFFFCGLSTTFWGALFGSWFGDAVYVISTTFFNKAVSIKPLWFEPINDPMKMLVFSMAIGIAHLYTGLAANLVQCIQTKRYKDIFYDVVFWCLLVSGLVVIALSSETVTSIFNIQFTLPSSAGSIAGIVSVVSAIGIVLTAGRESRNWFKRILKGLYGLYNVTGYLSDILSYSRLLALGLATGVIASVINQMGAMKGGGILSAIVFILVFIIGHSINMGINLLGAYVHTNRLTFVEFFGKFYEGGGKEFMPFSLNTKYYKLEEE
ncbi:MAG: V-type ATP synthase subunit I [Caldicoprobacterales bacterium]|jgi:V/A-type H+-transporting ATPase subunit I